MRDHWPIFRTASSAFAPFVVVAIIHREALGAVTPSLSVVAWVLAGVLYTHFVEYWCHRVPMHGGIRLIDNVRRNHLAHHAIFHGTSFRTRDRDLLGHIAGRYWVFPILFVAHYLTLVFVLPTTGLLAFLFGAVAHYTVFEVGHWLTHVEDNAFDRWIARVPLLADVRAAQIEHHRIHHEVPVLAFNFTPPYLGDRLFGHMPCPAESYAEPVAAEELLVPLPAVESPARWWRLPLVRYGSAAAVGVALVGAVVVAHGLWSHSKRAAAATTTQA